MADKILVLPGSIRNGSYTVALANAVTQRLIARGADVTSWNLAELPLSDPEYHANPSLDPRPAVHRFVEAADETDAFVLASPVYHNSYSGVLKNALDILAIPQFQYKAVGLLGHGGLRTTQAVDHLRIVARGLLAVALPTQVCTSRTDFVQQEGSERWEISAPDIQERIERFVNELLIFSTTLSALRHA